MANHLEDSLPNEWRILLVLAAVQFAHICDFVILMPLGPMLMRELALTPAQFGVLVSVYTLSAGLFSIFAAVLLDRFDRKLTLVGLFIGFLLATALCGWVNTYFGLLVARALAGAFGGTLHAVIFAIISDVVPVHRRGVATGTVMAAFSAASVLGLPLGLVAAERFGWQAPFLGLAIICIAILIAAMRWLPSVTLHLKHGPTSGLSRITKVLSDRKHQQAFGLIVAMMFAGFSVIPFLSPYLVSNAGLAERDLPYVYFVGGIVALFTSRYIGRLTDRYGMVRIFSLVALLSLVPIFIVTHLPPAPLLVILSITTSFMVLVSGRMVPAMALITTVSEPQQRGSFLLVTSSVQQLSVSLASFTASRLVIEVHGKGLVGFTTVGWIAIGSTLIAIGLARVLRSEPASQVTQF